METRKKLFVPLFITFLMVVGAFAVMVPAPGAPAAVGGQDPIDTRAMTGEPISVFDAFMEEQEALQPETMNVENVNPVAEKISDEEAPLRSEVSDHIVVTSEVAEGTRAPGVDAGGPYGGPDVYEGTTITFTATVDDPSLIFFRWDFNNDGVADTPWRLSLTMSDSIDQYYDDDYFGDITVEAWDGVSTTTIFHTGDVMDGFSLVNWVVYPATIGYLFRPKAELTLTQLGFYGYAYFLSQRLMILWDVNTQTQLRWCDAPMSTYTWNWCSISPITLTPNDEYILSIYKSVDYYPYVAGTNWANIETDTDYFVIDEGRYKWAPFGFPSLSDGQAWLAMLDFKFQWTEVVPLTESDTAFVEVNNIAPTVFNVQTNPPMAYEGGQTSFTAEFEDPGTGDDWEYRWDFGDGDFSSWFKVNKLLGGARVLYIHAYVGTNADAVINEVIDFCGDFCTVWDTWDYGPIGTNMAPELDMMLQYDVILTGNDYYVYDNARVLGDRLADFMDAGGAVVGMTFGYGFPPGGGIAGRFIDDEYTPVELASNFFTNKNLGTIYVPGHPILNGVSSVSGYYGHATTTLTSGATRIADWNNGHILVAERTNPMVANGAISMYINSCPYTGQVGGDFSLLVSNSIKYASQQPDPVPKIQPITTDPVSHVYRDDDPTSTSPFDDVTVRVEVRDDDHNKLKGGYDDIMSEGFDGITYPSWPAGWYASPSFGWRVMANQFYCEYSNCAAWYYYYNYGPSTSTFYGPSIDMSTKPYIQATLGFKFTWYTFSNPSLRGYVDLSTDGGITWTNVWYRESPPFVYDLNFQASIPVDFIGGSSDVRLRFRVESTQTYAYYFFGVDDIWI
ncbi:MAG: hypothetical protein V3V91_00195, partial [Thermoplasmata archaeon]